MSKFFIRRPIFAIVISLIMPTNNNEFTPRLTFAHRTYSLDLAERNTKCATISVYLADIASLKIICINWYCF